MPPGHGRDTVTPCLRARDISVTVRVPPLQRVSVILARQQSLRGIAGHRRKTAIQHDHFRGGAAEEPDWATLYAEMRREARDASNVN